MDNLIFDRTQTDVTYAAELNRKLGRGESLTAQELADWNAGLKGAYNAADMNRVDAAVRELGGMLTAAGYPAEYVDPHNFTPAIGNEVELTADDLQQGAWLYATGKHSDMENYICTNAMIPIEPDIAITARVDIDILSDSGFVWYDADMAYIGGTNNGAPILWGNCFQAIPPANAAYCNININVSAVTPADIGTVYVRQVANPESAGLPEEYTQVEYIESHGTEYIDTGFKPDNNTRIILDVYLNAVADNTEAAIFGARTAADSNGFYMFQEGSATGNYTDGYGGTHSQDINASGTGRHIIDKNKNKTYIDNDLMHTYSQTTFQAPVTLCIMAVNQASGVDERFGAIKLYSCQIYDNDIVIRCYIPCTNSAGIVGLYDTVSGAFFRDANSSSVEPVELPDGYTQVEYIQSSANGGQYIDAGFTPSSNTRIVATISNFPRTKTNQTIFGSRTQAGSSDAFMFLTTSQNVYRTDFGSRVISYSSSVSFDDMLTIDKNKNVTTLNGGNTVTATNSTFTSRYSMYIFANGGGGDKFYAKGVKLYNFKAYSNDTLIRDFVPCKNSSGEVGLYDFDGGKFYANRGTGSFTAGRAISDIGFAHGDVIPRPPARDYWIVGDIIDQEAWTQYIVNVKSIRDAYYTMLDSPELPAPTAPLTFDGANAVEKLLYDVSQLYDAMVASYRLCGALKCGNNAQHLPLQRSVI